MGTVVKNTQLSDSMLLVTLSMGLAFGIYHAVLIATGSGVGFFGSYRTQRQRYVMLFIAQAIIAGAVFYTLSFGSLSEYRVAVSEWWNADAGPVGWIIASASAMALFSPLVTLLCAAFVYWRPATFAKSAGKGWMYTTWGWRNRRTVQLRSVMPEFYDPDEHYV